MIVLSYWLLIPWVLKLCCRLTGYISIVVWILADLTEPSSPFCNSFTTASLHLFLGMSSWIMTTSPTCMVPYWLYCIAMWVSPNDIEYSPFQQLQKCCRSMACALASYWVCDAAYHIHSLFGSDHLANFINIAKLTVRHCLSSHSYYKHGFLSIKYWNPPI